MPEFVPSFADAAARPSDSLDFGAFLRGYMGAAEWLAYDDALLGVDAPDFALSADRRDMLKGWTRKAQVAARRDCRDFFRANADDLAEYCEARMGELRRCRPVAAQDMCERDFMEYAGHDFYLSRNGHGAGFHDRGVGVCFVALQRAARVYGEAQAVMLSNGWLGWM